MISFSLKLCLEGASWLEGDGKGNPISSLVQPYLTTKETVISNFNKGSNWYTTGGTAPDSLASWTSMFAKLLSKQQSLSSNNDDVDPTLAELVNRATAAAKMNAAQKLIVDYQVRGDSLGSQVFRAHSLTLLLPFRPRLRYPTNTLPSWRN